MKTKKGSTTVQSLLFTYDAFCNLATRKDVSHNMEESFFYDTYNRLTEVGLNGVHSQVMTYDGYGRMTSKTAGGQAVFSGAVYDQTPKPHALDKAVTASGLFPSTPQTVSYTGFDKVGKVKMGNDSLVYTYGYGHQRIAMEEHVGNTVRTKRYVGACERVTETMGSLTTDRWLTYLTGPTGVVAVEMTKSGTEQVFYVLKDNLGSWTTITEGSGVAQQRLSYDAWGNLRNPNTWATYTSDDTYDKPMFDRGFTGHEHLASFGLVNMNGRMYDPVMCSFLSADRYVQSPMSAQGFNRYAYCMNNPLRFVDPTGWLSGGGGGGPGGPLPKVVMNGLVCYLLPEVSILADNPSLSNTYEYEEYEYTPNISSGGFNTGRDGTTAGWSSGGHSGGSGGGSGNHGNNSSIKYMLLDYHQKYQHHTQTDIKGCKIATARSYYQYFSGKDLGESYFSTLVGGMIAVDKDTYLFEYYKACGLNVSDGMNVTIIEIGHQLEEGHPYSIVLKGEHTSNMDHVVTMVGIYKENADSSLKVFIKDPMQQNGQYYEWVEFREDIKDAYFITGLKKHQL